jgi:glycosyltransferase involved in cell wall biosynthesis
MEGRSLVSIAINNYNYGRYLGAAIDSALSQDYQYVEIVVVDDGSTDSSRDVVRRYGDKISAVLQPNGGQGAAYNAGFAACHGQIVVFLDADDRLYPNAVTEIVKRFCVGVSKVQFGLNLIDGEGRSLGRPVLKIHPDPETFLPLLHKFLFYPSPPSSGNAYSRSFVAGRLPLPPDRWRRSADGYLILAAPLEGKIVHIDECLGDYRRHGGGVSDRASNDLVYFVKNEYGKIVLLRDYVATLLGSSLVRPERPNYAFPPAYLKFVVAESFLCRPESTSLSLKLGFIREAIRAAKGWKPWPIGKRCFLILWILLVCTCPPSARRRLLSVSLNHSGY